MGVSLLRQQFALNGVLSTDDSVLSNMEKIAASCSCWITYDIHQGKWAVIINRAGTSVKSFDDSNILGAINVTSTGLTELYNGVRVSYPSGSLNDQQDWVRVDIPDADRTYGEKDQVLDMNLYMTNDQVQAELIALLELKQNRVDKVISFVTDFTALDLKAGDLIDITNSTWGWTEKMFRIVSLREVDGDSGINIEISALEYDAAVYDNDLTLYERSNNDGILAIGGIAAPAAPTLTSYDRDARPRVAVTAYTPTGVVNGMEFWVSQSSSTTGFNLVDIKRPQTTTTYAPNTQIDIDIDTLNAGNVWVRTRAFNADIDGPFSQVTNVSYNPVQVTNAVDPNTEVVDGSGNLLTTALLTTLLTKLDGLYSTGSTDAGSLFTKIFDVFNSRTGVDIINNIPSIANSAVPSFTSVQAGGATLSASTGQVLTINAGTNVSISGSAGTNAITINASGGGGVGGNLTDLGDVNISSATTNQVLRYNGSQWVNGSDLWEGSRKFVSASAPSGASDGDIWFQI